MTQAEGRRDQVLRILRSSVTALDDDEIAAAAQMNRVYVNMICRQLADDGLISRGPGRGGKLVNAASGRADYQAGTSTGESVTHGPRARVARLDRADLLSTRVRDLAADFASYVAVFEAEEAFPWAEPVLP